MDIIKQPHDKFFKEVFSNPEVMQDFIINYLPAEILAIININNLTLENNSFIDPELTESFSDLLFKTNISNKETYIYFLFEHKSYLSPYTPLQLLKYLLKIWEIKINKEKGTKLPLIIPIVIYHGIEKWQIGTEFIKMIEGIEELPFEIIKYIPNYEYILYDLATYEVEEIKGNIILKETIKILQAIYQDLDKFLGVVERTMTTLEGQGWTEDYHRYFITYIIYIINARADLDIEDIYEVAKNFATERSADIMTIAEKLIKEGMEKGIEKGILEGKKKTARNLLRQGISPEQVAEAAELPIEQILQLQREIEG